MNCSYAIIIMLLLVSIYYYVKSNKIYKYCEKQIIKQENLKSKLNMNEKEKEFTEGFIAAFKLIRIHIRGLK